MVFHNSTYNGTTSLPSAFTINPDFDEEVRKLEVLHRVGYVAFFLIILIGTPLNLWFLAAIATSTQVRTRLRNQIMCVLHTTFLFICTIDVSFNLSWLVQVSFRFKTTWHCSKRTAWHILEITSDWLEECVLLVWVSIYVATLIRIDFYKKLSPLVQKTGRYIIVFGPVVMCSILGPSFYAYYSHQEYGFHPEDCLEFTDNTLQFFKYAVIFLPFFAKMVMIPAVLVLHWRVARLSRNAALLEDSTTQQVVETPTAYVTACAVALGARTLSVIGFLFQFDHGSFADGMNFWFPANYVLPKTPSLFVPLCFLLLPDIRNRLKTWRPWRRNPISECDTIVRYQRQTETE